MKYKIFIINSEKIEQSCCYSIDLTPNTQENIETSLLYAVKVYFDKKSKGLDIRKITPNVITFKENVVASLKVGETIIAWVEPVVLENLYIQPETWQNLKKLQNHIF